MTGRRPLTIGIVAGEQSGQNLAVDLLDEIERETGMRPRLVGVGGDTLADRGLESVFDPAEIAITGLSAVIASLPRLVLRIRQTAAAIIAARPDAVIFIDSPDFSHRVARRVKRALPETPIVKYVAPTVWAWRPGRAKAMKATFDHVLAILPFEPEVMASLDGPRTSYVGHPLAVDAVLARVREERRARVPRTADSPFTMLVLPGSRTGELKSLLPDFACTVKVLQERGRSFDLVLPTLPRFADRLRQETASWPVVPRIVVSQEDKLAAFRAADVALAASGTILLELALAGVPVISIYRSDPVMRLFLFLITTWTAALPNIIADRPLIPEFFDIAIRPEGLARHVEDLATPESLAARRQLEGFDRIRDVMWVDEAPGARAARIILEEIAGATR